MLGSGSSKPTAFDRYHPAVAFGYFACMLAFSMAAMQPVYLALSLAAALAYSVVLRGMRATLRTALWQMPLILVMAVANPLFSAMGSTELFRIGLRAFYLESLVFGACMGAMLAGVLLWFSNASRVLSSDKVMALFGNAAPTIGLMLSMAMRLVPQFMRRGATVGDVQRACTSAGATGLREGARSRLRMTSVLMGWGMEDSLETADAMRARGWGACARRTAYQRRRFRVRDGAALGVLAALAVPNAVLAYVACTQFHFYPTLSTLAVWWGYVPFAVLAFAPLALVLGEPSRWTPFGRMASRSRIPMRRRAHSGRWIGGWRKGRSRCFWALPAAARPRFCAASSPRSLRRAPKRAAWRCWAARRVPSTPPMAQPRWATSRRTRRTSWCATPCGMS